MHMNVYKRCAFKHPVSDVGELPAKHVLQCVLAELWSQAAAAKD